MRVRRLDHLRLDCVQSLERCIDVIVPAAGGSDSFAAHEKNALVVDTASPAACLGALERLVDEAVLRDRLRWQAISDVCEWFPERAAFHTLRR